MQRATEGRQKHLLRSRSSSRSALPIIETRLHRRKGWKRTDTHSYMELAETGRPHTASLRCGSSAEERRSDSVSAWTENAHSPQPICPHRLRSHSATQIVREVNTQHSAHGPGDGGDDVRRFSRRRYGRGTRLIRGGRRSRGGATDVQTCKQAHGL